MQITEIRESDNAVDTIILYGFGKDLAAPLPSKYWRLTPRVVRHPYLTYFHCPKNQTYKKQGSILSASLLIELEICHLRRFKLQLQFVRDQRDKFGIRRFSLDTIAVS